MHIKHLILVFAALLAAPATHATNFQWTNTLGGNFEAWTNWSPNGVPTVGDSVNITAPGTYTVTNSSITSIWSLTLGGASGTQTLRYTGSSPNAFVGACVVKTSGVLVNASGGMSGTLTIQPGGTLLVTGAASRLMYSLNLVNQGTVTWSAGAYNIGDTVINNAGLWEITSDHNASFGGGAIPLWINTGTLRKSGGAGVSTLGYNFANQPGALVDVQNGTLVLGGGGTNLAGGAFIAASSATLNLGSVWTDAGGTASGSGICQLASGTLYLRTNIVPGLKLAGGEVYLAGATFQQAGIITNLTLDGATLRGTNTVDNGILTFNSGLIAGKLTIQPAAQLLLPTTGDKRLYSSQLFNLGTVTWTGGSVYQGDNSVVNNGLWTINGNLNFYFGGGAAAIWTNTGILRKTSGGGPTTSGGLRLWNQPSGLVDVQSGTLQFSGGGQLTGTFNAAAGCFLDLTGGVWTDAGGAISGAGTTRLNGATLNLRTNIIPGLQLALGDIYVTGTNTFQQAGAITNLTLDGATLHGTNTVGAGTLAFNGGKIIDRLTVRPGGRLTVSNGANKLIYDLTLINQGTVACAAGMNVGGTVISNGGLWQFVGDVSLSYGGGALPIWTNGGTIEKTAGAGTTVLTPFSTLFFNQPGSMVKCSSGTVQLPAGSPIAAGTLRANGGTINANGTLAVSGGTVDGAGTIGATAFTGGAISPGIGGPGLLAFSSGLNLSSNTTLVFDGTGTTPGSGYDQLSVAGAVALNQSVLQVTALPSVGVGTNFVLITNDGTDAVIGTFFGLPEAAGLVVGAQLFQLSYHGGDGNDVTLTRLANPSAQAQFSGIQRQAGGAIQLAASGKAGLTYTVQANPNLTTTNWIGLGSVTADALGMLSFTDLQATNFPARFYRFVWP